MLCCATTSSPIVGSSRNSTSGECSRAAINSIFIRSPSDSSRTGCRSSVRTVEQVDQLVARVVERGRLDAIDFLVQAKRFLGRQVPPQLVFLPHHQGEAAAIGVFAPPGNMAHHASPCREVGVITPERSLSVVVLPAPFGPRKATNSPCSTVRSIPRTAWT